MSGSRLFRTDAEHLERLEDGYREMLERACLEVPASSSSWHRDYQTIIRENPEPMFAGLAASVAETEKTLREQLASARERLLAYEAWQAGERAASADIAAGRVTTHKSTEDFLAALDDSSEAIE